MKKTLKTGFFLTFLGSSFLFSDFMKLTQVAENALPAVVSIVVRADSFSEYFEEDTAYYEFLRPYYEFLWPSSKTIFGSGAIIHPSGYIVTNAHVVANGLQFRVFSNKTPSRSYKATLIGVDPRTDLAVLKIKNKDGSAFPFLRLGDSDSLQIGEDVVAIGSPGGGLFCESSLTTGVISALDRDGWNRTPIEGYIQFDSPVNPGNSGGPLVNQNSEIIGIVTWQYYHLRGIVGLNFAIPSYTVGHVVDQLIANECIEQGFLGIKVETDPDEEYYNCGAVIEKVLKGSPAFIAGLKFEDIIVELDGMLINSALNLRNKIAVLEPGRPVDLVVNRAGSLLKFTIFLGEEDKEQFLGDNHLVL